MDRLQYVHITQGTASVARFSHGNTLPLTQRPHGMAAYAPQTEVKHNRWFYHPAERSLEGVRLTHQPSPWIGDYAALIMMPQAGKAYTQADERWSGYRPEDARLAPDYMKLHFLRSDATFELTPTERGAAIRVEYGNTAQTPYFSVFGFQDDLCFEIDPENGCLYGCAVCRPEGAPRRYRMHFALQFDCPIDKSRSEIIDGCAVHLALTRHDVGIRLATSYISREQALLTMERELRPGFEKIRRQAALAWENLLDRIDIETDDDELMNTFYTCLYRVFTYPHKMYELDAAGLPIHYDSYNDTVTAGILYTDNGFWDTFRTLYPLYSLIAPDMYREILEGFLQIYRNTGWLPKWTSMNEIGLMPGTLIDGVLADAAVKGLLQGDSLRLAFEAMRKHAQTVSEDRFGRVTVAEYERLGYVPRDRAHESVNSTLDYAYGDFCIARVAEVLGETEVQLRYDRRARNYRNIFDPETGFMRGRDMDGRMSKNFDSYLWGGEYTEGGPWQNSFAVYHDIGGLADLHGGVKALVKKLDDLFVEPPYYRIGDYAREIHEMTEMASVSFGQCAISNQPSFHIPYIYAALGYPEKTNYWVHRLLRELFSCEPDGFPGDEDNGSMSAWFIFSCMGLYPICPGKAEYLCTEPVVERVFINKQLVHPHMRSGQYITHTALVQDFQNILKVV